jgi:hypothetical protein
MSKLTISKNTAIVDEDDDFLGKLMAGCEGNITIKSPFIKGGKLEIKEVKNKAGKVIGKQKKVKEN